VGSAATAVLSKWRESMDFFVQVSKIVVGEYFIKLIYLFGDSVYMEFF
jgi:hypothetical protein